MGAQDRKVGAAARPELQGAAPPRHVAVIMDGNGRWAAARHLPRAAGHRAGAQAVRRTIEAAIGAGVTWLTLYAFSSENWRRPADEVLELTGLLKHYLRQELAELAGRAYACVSLATGCGSTPKLAPSWSGPSAPRSAMRA